MKLRNKKTGDITIIEPEYEGFIKLVEKSLPNGFIEWEVVENGKPTEPLIKDPKIRKAVRAWAEASGAISIVVFDCNNVPCLKIDEMEFAENGGRASISFKTSEKIDTSKAYTIEELCGNE